MVAKHSKSFYNATLWKEFGIMLDKVLMCELGAPFITSSSLRRMSIFGFTKEARDRRQRDANSTTMMLIVVIAVFLAVETPLAVISALHTISSRCFPLPVFVWVSVLWGSFTKVLKPRIILVKGANQADALCQTLIIWNNSINNLRNMV